MLTLSYSFITSTSGSVCQFSRFHSAFASGPCTHRRSLEAGAAVVHRVFEESTAAQEHREIDNKVASLSVAQMEAAQCVRTYKSLSDVERAFRALKTVDLHVRPIQHRTADRVRAHIFLCVLAYYVEWHLREAWRDLLFADPDQAAKATRDPVAPAVRSKAAQAKASYHTLDDGTPTHSFATLLAELATIVRNTCRTPHAGPDAPTFEVLTTPNAKQQRAFTLLQQIHV